MSDIDAVGQAADRFPAREASPDLHDWTLHEHVRGLLAVLDAREARARGEAAPTGPATDAARARADESDLVRMDSDLG